MSDQDSSRIVRTRFAPSPSGHLHVGGARTALFCWAYARGRDGRFILRIEDTDQKRSSDAATAGFMEDLCWLGINWDEGPEFESCGGGDTGPYRQSERLEFYTKFLNQLVDEGNAYYAFETPEELAAQRAAARAEKRPYVYNRAALELSPEEVQRNLDEGRPAVIRFKTPNVPVTIMDEVLGEATVPAGEIDDFVIRKADGYPTYHFAVVVDDELMGVTHVLRAQEHFKNTAKHLLLQEALGFNRPVYAHLSVMVNPDNSKMSKRDKDKLLRATIKDRQLAEPPTDTMDADRFNEWIGNKDVQLELNETEALASALGVSLPEINVEDFRRSGYLAETLCNFMALNGWSPGDDLEKFDNEFLATRFDFDRAIKTPAKFDRVKLQNFNNEAIDALAPKRFASLMREHAERYHPEFLSGLSSEQFALFVTCNQKRSKTLEQPFADGGFFIANDDQIEFVNTKATRKAIRRGGEHLPQLRELLAALEPFTVESLETTVQAYADEHAEGNLGNVAQPLRIAVSGATVSPPIFETLVMLGRTHVVARIDRCLQHDFTA